MAKSKLCQSKLYIFIEKAWSEVSTAHLFHFNKFQDEIQTEIDANVNAKQSLDEITQEVNNMKSELTKNPDTGDPVSDGDGNGNGGGGGGAAAGGNSQRAALGEIAKIKQIAEILENIVLPTIVDTAQAAGSPADHQSDPIKIIPKGLKLLQHHSAITSNIDDGNQAATNQKPNPQSVDNWYHSKCTI